MVLSLLKALHCKYNDMQGNDNAQDGKGRPKVQTFVMTKKQSGLGGLNQHS